MSWSLLAHTAQANGTSSAIDTTGADLLVIVAGSNTPTTPTDSKSNTWTLAGQTQAGGSGNYSIIWYCQGGTVGSGHTFTNTAGASAFTVLAFSGSTTSPLDVQGTGSGSSGTSLGIGSITPSANNELIVAAFSNAGSVSGQSIDSGMTITDTVAGGATYGVASAWVAQGTAAAIAPTWSWTTSNSSAGRTASFKAAAGGVSGTLAKTNANDTSVASGTTTVTGTLTKTNANDTVVATGTTTVTGTLAKTNANDTVNASGTVGAGSITGTLATTNSNDTSVATGTTTITGTLAKTNSNDTSTGSGTTTVLGTLFRTNLNDIVSAFGPQLGTLRRMFLHLRISLGL